MKMIKMCGGFLSSRPGARPGAAVGGFHAAAARRHGGRASGGKGPSENLPSGQEPGSHPQHGEGEEGGL